jgi:hypothetical protein
MDMNRDRGLLGGVVDALDVAGWSEAADVADVVVALADPSGSTYRVWPR